MVFTNPYVQEAVDPAPPPADPGTYTRVLGTDTSKSLIKLEKIKPGNVKNGNYFFYSVCIQTVTLAQYGEMAFTLVPYIDDDLYFFIALNFGEDGIMEQDGAVASNGVYYTPVAGGNLTPGSGYWLRPELEEGTGDNKNNITILPKNWVWISFYIAPSGNQSLLRINGVPVNHPYIDSVSDTSNVNPGSTTLGAMGLRRNYPGSQSSEFRFAQEWLCSAADGSVIGQPDFHKNFFNIEDGSIKELGDGIVEGITPHHYFSSKTSPQTNDINGEVYDLVVPEGTNPDISLATGTKGVNLIWQTDPARTYTLVPDPNIGGVFAPWSVNSYLNRSPVCGKLFGAMFFNRAEIIIEAGDTVDAFVLRTRPWLTVSGGTGANVLTMSSDGASSGFSYGVNRGGSDQISDWNFVTVYYDIVGNVLRLTRNATTNAGANISSGPGEVVVSAEYPNIQVKGASSNRVDRDIGFVYVYDQTIIDANPGIPWTDNNAMFDYFVDTDTRTMKGGGYDGTLAIPGVTPYIYVSPASGLGLNSANAIECGVAQKLAVNSSRTSKFSLVTRSVVSPSDLVYPIS